MSGRVVHVRGRRIWLLEGGCGAPLLYLHGFADVHAVKDGWLPFHTRLLERARVIAPAHPGCSSTDENPDVESIDDVVFHYLEMLDSLELSSFDLVGSCLGGWIAAELAARHPEKVRRLVLIGAMGLFVKGSPIGDLFMMAQPERGSSYAGLRRLLFADPDHPSALELFPDGKGDLEEELRRYQMLRFASRIGFRPPYFYSRPLAGRLHRVATPALVIWGRQDRLVAPVHAETYVHALPCARLEWVANAGHAVPVEEPEAVARLIAEFLG
ncbi:MAG TPA: alpha/beta fold hydrolase [candidate division Zixibacteria bacterium]|nr:alpha/beta fold hydrolase [candidate division Zixibacteria bacterium]